MCSAQGVAGMKRQSSDDRFKVKWRGRTSATKTGHVSETNDKDGNCRLSAGHEGGAVTSLVMSETTF